MSRFRRSPVISILLILNAIVFMCWTLFDGEEKSFMVQNFLVSWSGLVEGRMWTLLTSVFSHSMFLHFLVNMFVLTNFGPIVLRVLGSKSFLNFYILAGIVSSLGHSLVCAYLLNQPELPALGASGAIAGIILLFALIFPKEKIFLLGFIPLPAIFGALAVIGLDIWGLIEQMGGHGLPIGHGAHLGGAFTGIVYYFYSVRPRLKTRIGY